MNPFGSEIILGAWTFASPVLKLAYLAQLAAIPFGITIRLGKGSDTGERLFQLLHATPVLWVLIEVTIQTTLIFDLQLFHCGT